MQINQFPLLSSSVTKTERFENALKVISSALESGSIRNVDLKQAKETLSRIVDDAFKLNISSAYVHAGQWESLPKEVYDFYESVNIYGLHDIIAANKKLNKTTLVHPLIGSMKAFVAEVLPLAEAVASLKDKIVKGRVIAEPKPVNPNKIIKTCPCCFRKIAVVGKVMAHHGYKRPGTGWQTSSCPGVRFNPLEVSSKGLEWLISQVEGMHDKSVLQYINRENLTELKIGHGKTEQIILKDSKFWVKEYGYYCQKLRLRTHGLLKELINLKLRLKDWKPSE